MHGAKALSRKKYSCVVLHHDGKVVLEKKNDALILLCELLS
jgi:hypothetical protein